MANIGLLAWISFKDSIRNKALYGIFIFGLLLFITNIIIAGMFTWEVGKVAVDVGLSAVSLSGLIIIFFFSINMVTNDLERKTIYLILSRPISKMEYILGKYAGLALIILVSSLVLGVCATVSVKLATWGAEAHIPANFTWWLFGLSLVYQTLALLLILAIAFVCISVTTHPFTAMLLCLISYFVGQNVEKVGNAIMRTQMFEKNIVLQQVVRVIKWLIPNLAAFDLKSTAAYGLPVDGGYLGATALYGVAYMALCLVITIMIFNRRELG